MSGFPRWIRNSPQSDATAESRPLPSRLLAIGSSSHSAEAVGEETARSTESSSDGVIVRVSNDSRGLCAGVAVRSTVPSKVKAATA